MVRFKHLCHVVSVIYPIFCYCENEMEPRRYLDMLWCWRTVTHCFILFFFSPGLSLSFVINDCVVSWIISFWSSFNISSMYFSLFFINLSWTMSSLHLNWKLEPTLNLTKPICLCTLDIVLQIWILDFCNIVLTYSLFFISLHAGSRVSYTWCNI